MSGNPVQELVEARRPGSALEAGIGNFVELDFREKWTGRSQTRGAMAVTAEEADARGGHDAVLTYRFMSQGTVAKSPSAPGCEGLTLDLDALWAEIDKLK